MPSRPKSQAPTASRNQDKGSIQIVYRGPTPSAATRVKESNEKANRSFGKKRDNVAPDKGMRFGWNTFRNKKNDEPIPVRLQTFDEWIQIGLCDESIDGASLPPLKTRGIRMQRTKKKLNPSNELSEHRQDDEAALPSIAEAKCEDADEKDNQDKPTNGHRDSARRTNEGGIQPETAAANEKGSRQILTCIASTDLEKCTSEANIFKDDNEKDDHLNRAISKSTEHSTAEAVGTKIRSETTELPSLNEICLREQSRGTTLLSAFELHVPKQDVSVSAMRQEQKKSTPMRFECSLDLPTTDTCNLQFSYIFDLVKRIFCSLPECRIPIEIEIHEQHFPCSAIASDQNDLVQPQSSCAPLSPTTLEQQNMKDDEMTMQILDTSNSNDRPSKNKRIIEPHGLQTQTKVKGEMKELHVLRKKKQTTKINASRSSPVLKPKDVHGRHMVSKQVLKPSKADYAHLSNCKNAQPKEPKIRPPKSASVEQKASKDTKSKGRIPVKAYEITRARTVSSKNESKGNSTGTDRSDISSISTSSSFTSNDIKITDSKVEVVFEVQNQKLGIIIATDSSSSSSNTHSRDSSSDEPSSHSASSNNSGNSSHDSSDGYYSQDLGSYFKDVVEMKKSFRFLS